MIADEKVRQEVFINYWVSVKFNWIPFISFGVKRWLNYPIGLFISDVFWFVKHEYVSRIEIFLSHLRNSKSILMFYLKRWLKLLFFSLFYQLMLIWMWIFILEYVFYWNDMIIYIDITRLSKIFDFMKEGGFPSFKAKW